MLCIDLIIINYIYNTCYCRFFDIIMSFIENQDDAVVDLEADVQQATINVSELLINKELVLFCQFGSLMTPDGRVIWTVSFFA